jgi:hypothetical protein
MSWRTIGWAIVTILIGTLIALIFCVLTNTFVVAVFLAALAGAFACIILFSHVIRKDSRRFVRICVRPFAYLNRFFPYREMLLDRKGAIYPQSGVSLFTSTRNSYLTAITLLHINVTGAIIALIIEGTHLALLFWGQDAGHATTSTTSIVLSGASLVLTSVTLYAFGTDNSALIPHSTNRRQ